MTPVTPTDITPGIAGSWQTVDVTAYVDAGNTSGVILHIEGSASSDRQCGVRKYGSTDTVIPYIDDNTHTWCPVGVDASDRFEAYIGNTDVTIRIVAYLTNDEATFNTDWDSHTVSSTGTWEDWDISTLTGGDTATFALVYIVNESASSYDGTIRENGSTDNRKPRISNWNPCGIGIGVDGSEILECYADHATNIVFYLVGWMTKNVTTWANAKDYGTGTAGSYQEVDVSSDVPDGNNGAFFWQGSIYSTSYQCNIKTNGGGLDVYEDAVEHFFPWVELDGDRKAQQKVEHTNCDLFLNGYTMAGAEPESYSYSASGAETPAGALGKKLSANRSKAGTETPSGAITRKYHAVRTSGGIL